MRPLTHALAATTFVALATLNSGGYRFGASDQAFYIPAILTRLDPTLLPRDSALIGPQAKYFFVDEIVAGAMRITGWSMEAWFALGYVLTLFLLYTALYQVGQVVFRSPYAPWALLAAETLRHRITKTGVNTLEGYFHPRVLVFAVGVCAIAACLRGRPWLALSALVAAGLFHPTTAAFFVVLLIPAIWVTEPPLRRPLGAMVTAGVVVVGWALLAGPLADGLRPMDPEWRALLRSKDYLFPAEDWNLGAWLANFGTAALAVAALAYRARHGIGSPRERGLLAGAAALTVGFLVTLPFVTAGSAFFVQLQISRVFWILDLLATLGLVWLVVDRVADGSAAARRRARALSVAVLLLSLTRGAWVSLVEHGDRPLIEWSLPATDWTRVIAWARAQPVGTHLLADPGHAWRFGTPLRFSGRDVFLEEVKDTAMGIYARDSAGRVIERLAAIGDFSTLDEDRARALAARYAIDYLVIDRDMALPEVARVGIFRIYSLARQGTH